MKKPSRVFLFTLIVFLLLFACIVGYAYLISLDLTVSHYTLKAQVKEPIRIVHLTDLHNTQFGSDNAQLVELVSGQQPDLIAITGDMLNRDEETLSVVTSLIRQLVRIAPVYYGYGNHEDAWLENWEPDLAEQLRQAGALVLNNNYKDVEINGTPLRIGGYMGYYRQPGMFLRTPEQKEAEIAFAEDFENTTRYKLLLNHIPTAWVDWEYIDKYPVDLILSGHYHGGLIRFFGRGLYAPYVGLFPDYTKGIYFGETATCVISAGLGSEHMIPRLNNPPEIVTIDLIPQE